MKMMTQSTTTAFLTLFGIYVSLLTTSAHADPEYIYFNDDVERTIIWSAVILAAGMIISAIILRKPGK